jgi:polyprenyl P-hydroxybenzoate/phenylacrylic acid decarboxylase-like protein
LGSSNKRIIVGITGASGAVYAQRVVGLLVSAGVQTHVVVSPLGQRLLQEELGIEGLNLETLGGFAKSDNRPTAGGGELVLHNYRDVGASIASGSFGHDGMVVVPCTSNTLGCIANGMAQNLLHRAAHVTLKERRRLVLVHREMPLSLVDIKNMQAVTEAGGIIAPANPGFYMLPKSIEGLVDFVAGRCLDLLEVEHGLDVRWSEPKGDEVQSGSGGAVETGPS